MSEQKNIFIPLSEKSDSVLVGIIKKYNLQETNEEAFEKTQKHDPFNENIVIQLTRNLMLEKISNKEFLDSLHKELNISEEVTKNLAIDIVHNLIPLLEKIPEDQLEEYNRKKSELEREKESLEPKKEVGKEEDGEEVKKGEFKKAKEELLGKLRATVKMEEVEPEPEAMVEPNLKKVGIPNVEKNAKTIQHTQQRPKEVAPIEEPEAPKEKKKPDPYKEPVE